MRKVYVNVKVSLIINADDDQEISDVLSEMGYDFYSQSHGAEIEDSTIEDWEITDSK